MMRALADILDRVSTALNRVALGGAVLSILILVLVAGWQVVARYVLDQPPPWTEELARYAMVWAGVLGASCAFRAGVDPSLFPGQREKRGQMGNLWAIIRAVGALAFATPILWYSVMGLNMNPGRSYIARLAGRQADTMDVPMVVFGIAIPVAFTLIIIHALAGLTAHFSGHEQAPDADAQGETSS